MSWRTLSLHFKQQYDGGYRYLDRCGEFMLDAVDRMGFMPGDIKPTGAKLEIPEKGLSAGLDAVELVASQDMPGSDDEFFVRTCIGLAELANQHFQPKRIIRNGWACKSFWPFTNAEQLLAATLKFDGNEHAELGKLLGMIPAHKQLDFNFRSGSFDFHVHLHAVTFEKVSVSRHNPSFKASADQKQRVERLNRFADRINEPLSHAMLLELDLMEVDPPKSALEMQYAELGRMTKILRQRFTVR